MSTVWSCSLPTTTRKSLLLLDVIGLLTSTRIKEVLTFPFMKDVEEPKNTAAEVVGIEPKAEEGIRKLNSSLRHGKKLIVTAHK